MLTTKEREFMKILKITDSKGEFSVDGVNYLSVVDIAKEDIQKIIRVIITENIDIEYDEITNEKKVLNGAEKIIYENILASLKSLVENRIEIKNRIDTKFSSLKSKYIIE